MIYILFLKGINVGGRHKIKMAELCDHLREIGYSRVESYIQSGNLLLSSKGKQAGQKAIEKDLEEEISEFAGFSVPAFLISASDYAGILESFPFGPGHPDETGNRTFFTLIKNMDSAGIGQELSEKLEKFVSPGEKLVYSAKGLWLFCPDGYGKTRLNNLQIEKKLACSATTRNLKTLKKMAQLAREAEA